MSRRISGRFGGLNVSDVGATRVVDVSGDANVVAALASKL
jgi:hypothetical protein